MNILFLSIEDLNDWIEPLGGHPDVKTPNIARLAQRGMVFKNAYAAVPACSPSRTATLFGQAPWETGIYTNKNYWHQAFKPGARQSLVGCFRDAGWTTVGAGKIFHMDVEGRDPEDWDRYNTDAKHHRHPKISKMVQQGIAGRGNDFGAALPRTHVRDFDALNTDWICDQITPEADKTFWGFGLYRPHLPFIVPQQFFDLYPEDVALPPGMGFRAHKPRAWNRIKHLPEEARRIVRRNAGLGVKLAETGEYRTFLRAYLASISYADWQLGRVLDRLEQAGQSDRTFIVLWSDHGWQFGEKLAFRKFSLWERALRIPLIFAGPGVAKGESTCPVSLLDIFPTLAARFGVTPKNTLTGHDLGPAIEGAQWDRPAPVISAWGLFEGQEPGIAFSLRNLSHRYTLYWQGGEELYDAEADPFEHQNLINDTPETGNLRVLADGYQTQLGQLLPHVADPLPQI